MRLQSFEAIVRALDHAGVRYLIAGGMAVNAHGFLRFTKDLDLVLELVTDNVERAMATLDELGYRPTVPVPAHEFADPEKRREWIERKNMQVFQLWSERFPDTPIDIFVDEPFPFAEEYRRALVKPLGDSVDVPFISLDRLIDMKERVGREQDRIDVENLRRLQEVGDGS